MASSKKRKEEKAKLKNAETRMKAKPSPKKPKKSNKKTAIQNGTVSESKDEVVVTPASSSINDSQQDSETELEGRSQEQEATNEKKKKPNKNGKKIERDDDDEVSKVCNFPMGRIKRIFKTQSSDIGITGEAVFLVNKATDKFLEQFCEDAYECCAKDRKKSLAYKHLAAVVSEQSKYDFLSDYVPEKIKAEDALAQRELAEGGEG
ncbi:hypothetical protein AB3S75_039391 [Citrus x aurantiifolia]